MSSELITEYLNLEPELTGIQKLRVKILELAVRGKLVPKKELWDIMLPVILCSGNGA